MIYLINNQSGTPIFGAQKKVKLFLGRKGKAKLQLNYVTARKSD
jgi:hypothetical protein